VLWNTAFSDAMASTAFFSTLFFARRRIGLACLPIPILIAFSRMYIGAHYLSDVVCAAILGIICALVVAHFGLRKIANRTSQIEN
jgi:membrane-associated phospholipid phosphatase